MTANARKMQNGRTIIIVDQQLRIRRSIQISLTRL
jgi:hypothetical protein